MWTASSSNTVPFMYLGPGMRVSVVTVCKRIPTPTPTPIIYIDVMTWWCSCCDTCGCVLPEEPCAAGAGECNIAILMRPLKLSVWIHSQRLLILHMTQIVRKSAIRTTLNLQCPHAISTLERLSCTNTEANPGSNVCGLFNGKLYGRRNERCYKTV